MLSYLDGQAPCLEIIQLRKVTRDVLLNAAIYDTSDAIRFAEIQLGQWLCRIRRQYDNV